MFSLSHTRFSLNYSRNCDIFQAISRLLPCFLTDFFFIAGGAYSIRRVEFGFFVFIKNSYSNAYLRMLMVWKKQCAVHINGFLIS